MQQRVTLWIGITLWRVEMSYIFNFLSLIIYLS